MHLCSAALVSVLVHRLFSLKAQGDKWGFTPGFMPDSKQRRMGLEGRWWREDTAVKYLGKSFFISSSSLSQRSTSFSLPSQPWRTGLKVHSNLWSSIIRQITFPPSPFLYSVECKPASVAENKQESSRKKHVVWLALFNP